MHFFIEPNKLPLQTDVYGPDSANATGKFNVTSLFQLTEAAKAFACQTGMLIVQRNDSSVDSLVNVILKPLNGTQIAGIAVKYYVYRGIKIDSFFTKTNGVYHLNPSTTTNKSEFIDLVWKQYAEEKAKNPSSPEPGLLNVGYGANDLPIMSGNAPDRNSLNENRSIDDLFMGRTIASAHIVTEGFSIGEFGTSAKIGFEVVLESDLPIVHSLKAFRSASRSIETGTAMGLELRKIKEQIHSFIDPAAFFGMYHLIGVKYTNYTGTVKETSPRPEVIQGKLYTDVIRRFATRNRLYLDVRSEKGLSYNYYNTYKISATDARNIRINGAPESATPATQPQAKVYEANGWPILIIDENRTQSNQKNKVSFRLRINGNTEPVIYTANKEHSQAVASSASKTVYSEVDTTETGATNPATGQWTKDITMYVPHVGNTAIPAAGSLPATAANTNTAYLLKVYYFLGKAVSTGTDRPWNTKYYDSAFCSIDREGLGDTSQPNGSLEGLHPIYVKEPTQTDGTGNFYYVAKNGAYWDSQKVLFYCNVVTKRKSADGSGKNYLYTFEKRLSLTNTAYTPLKTQFNIISREYQRLDGTTPTTFRIIGINSYTEGGSLKEKESLMMLGITPAELTTLKNTTGLSPHSPRYIYLSPDAGNPLADTSAQRHRYHRYTVMLQGMDSTTNLPARINTSVIVYSRDNVFFGSQAFNALEDLSEGRTGLTASQQNRIEYHIYENGNIKINDNIDLALVRKSVPSTEHTVVPDTAIANDQSIAQRLYYVYHPTTGDPVDVCNFNVVMANAMKRVADPTTIPAGYNLTMTYTEGDAKRAFQNADGDVISIETISGTAGTKKHYQNQKKKIFMVHFVTNATTATSNVVFNATNNAGLNFTFSYSGSRRRYANPTLAAGILGGLIRDTPALTSTGFSFGDASCHPSAEHVDGQAMDSSYFQSPTSTWQQDVDFISALEYYGVMIFRVGMNLTALKTNLADETYYRAKVRVDTKPLKKGATTGPSLHDNHLHSTKITLRNNP